MYRFVVHSRFIPLVLLLTSTCAAIWWTGVSASASKFVPNTKEPKSSEAKTAKAEVTSPQFVTSINAFARRSNALVYHSQSNKIYASIPSGTDSIGNSIVTIDPTTGAIEKSVWVGSEPNKLVLANDGNSLYVTLDGARAIRRFDISSGSAGQLFPAGISAAYGALLPFDLAVSPTNSSVVAVSRIDAVTSSSRGIAIFDDGVQRTNVGGSGEAITFADTDTLLFGNTFYSNLLQRMTINAGGIASVSSAPGSAGKQLRFIGGRLYNSYGQVLDPVSGNAIGTFPRADSYGSERPFCVDIQSRRAFFAIRGNTGIEISAYDIDTFVLIGTIAIGVSGYPVDIVRWGSNGVAISVEDNLTYFVQSDLIGPGIILPPAPTPTPSPSPAVMSFIRRVNVRNNDILYNQSDGNIYASIPGVAGPGLGNTITRIDPNNGNVISSTFVGSEPAKLALSNDGGTLYTHLRGANAIRRFDTANQTSGLQFSLPFSNYNVVDLLVLPGSTDSLVVSRGSDGVKIYDNGFARPLSANIFGGDLEHNGTPNVIYAFDGATPSSLSKLAVDANGLSVLNTFRWVTEIANQNILFESGRLYTNQGRVLDPETGAISGQFYPPGSYFGGQSIVVDSNLRKAFMLTSDSIVAFDMDTYNLQGTIPYPNPYPNISPSNLIRWGANGLAFRVGASDGNSSIFIVQSPLVSASGTLPLGYALERSSGSVYEGAANATINVFRSGNTAVASSVNYATLDGTATAGSDYVPINGTLNFAVGETVKQLSIHTINDNVYEGVESLSLVLSNPTGPNSEIIAPASCAFSIIDGQYRPYISSAQSISVTEPSVGGPRSVDIPVVLTNQSTETVTVDFQTMNGTATAGSDYVATSGTLTFSPLQTSATVSVQILGDRVYEGNENFYLRLSNPINSSGLGNLQTNLTILNFVNKPQFADFDGDSKTDLSIFRPSTGQWWYQRSSDGQVPALQFGMATDKIVPGDFTGDGKTDIAFWRPSTGFWFILRSEDSSFFSFPFGANGDIPAPADYDGDGMTDPAVFRPSTSTWFVLNSGGGGTSILNFGLSTDKPVTADYDGDGKVDIAVFRPGDGSWWYLRSSDTQVRVFSFGVSTDRPVQDDYTGDGKADIAVFRPSTGFWYVLRSEDFSFYAFPFGTTGDVPVPGDYDGDGKADAAIFRPSTSTWYAQLPTAGILIQQFGAAGDLPVPNAFVH
ncbi:MAG: VCBS repeat-containing protein [Acidobacteria bacterium]|nr:VCBS repeat-containing protein [Acidobacteriota bacterium]